MKNSYSAANEYIKRVRGQPKMPFALTEEQVDDMYGSSLVSSG
jgi:hypothetical protein